MGSLKREHSSVTVGPRRNRCRRRSRDCNRRSATRIRPQLCRQTPG